MIIVGTDVYVAGYYGNHAVPEIACYWKNGTKQNLYVPVGAQASIANGIAVAE
jgi:hypothetical protein